MVKRLSVRSVRRLYGLSWWEWMRFRLSREDRSYRRARREAERERAATHEALRRMQAESLWHAGEGD